MSLKVARNQGSPSTGSRPGSARIVRTRSWATVVAGGRLFLVTLGHDRSDGRASFDTGPPLGPDPETEAVPRGGPSCLLVARNTRGPHQWI
jgi:hypothetical protein